MHTALFTHTEYTMLGTPYQLSLPLNIEFEIHQKKLSAWFASSQKGWICQQCIAPTLAERDIR